MIKIIIKPWRQVVLMLAAPAILLKINQPFLLFLEQLLQQSKKERLSLLKNIVILML